jgi:hypothetical protein
MKSDKSQIMKINQTNRVAQKRNHQGFPLVIEIAHKTNENQNDHIARKHFIAESKMISSRPDRCFGPDHHGFF